MLPLTLRAGDYRSLADLLLQLRFAVLESSRRLYTPWRRSR